MEIYNYMMFFRRLALYLTCTTTNYRSNLVLQLQLPRPPVNFVNVSTRAWKSFDEDSFRSELRSSKLCNPGEYGGASVDDLQELYDTTLRTLLDKNAPSRSARRRYQPITP